MKAGWEVRPLGDVCRLINGRAYKQAELLEAGPYPVLRVGNFFTNNHWYYSDLELDADKYCDDGDLLYAWSASFGPRIWQGGKVIYHYHIWKVAPDTGRLNRDYLYYFFDWDKELIKKEQGAGTTMIHVSKGSMEARSIPLPPLEEQQRIVAVLDEAFEGLARARAHAEANLQNARALMEAGLGTAFNPATAQEMGWQLLELSRVADLTYGYTTKAHSDPVGPRFLRITDIQDGEVDWNTVPYCDAPPDDYERYRVRPGDIVFARTGATTGKSYLLREDVEAVAASYLIRLRLTKPELQPEYLALYFQSDVYWEVIRRGISGSTQGGFNATKLGELVVPVPSLAIQMETVSRLHEIQQHAATLVSSYQSKLHSIGALRQSLLQKAFAGELT